MFERFEVTRARCWFCGTYGPVVGLPAKGTGTDESVDACERCLRATGKAADLLTLIRKAKAPPPKKARKGSQSRASDPPLHPAKEAVSSLVPQGDPLS